MTEQASEQDVVQILSYMAAAWPRQEMTEQTVAVYVMHMLRSGLAADVLLLAAMALVETLAFFPSVAEWREKALWFQEAREGWYMTANYRLWGHELPAELRLPAGMGQRLLGYEPVYPELPAGEVA